MRPKPWGLLLLVGLSAPARATPEAPSADEPPASPARLSALLPFLAPWLVAYGMDREGFARWPYDEKDAYGKGERPLALSLSESSQLAGGGHTAQHEDLALRSKRGLGLDAEASTYSGGTFGRPGAAGFYRSNFTANYLQSDKALLEFGMGIGVFQAPQSSWGPSWDLSFEAFPKSPWSFRSRYQLALLGGRAFHEISFGAGATWRWFGVGAGLRSLLNPLRNATGPELTARAWL